jgi:hypothetical protein
MMEELVQELSQKTGLPQDKAQEDVNVIVSHLKARLPGPLASALDSVLAGGAAESGGLAGEEKAIAAELGGMFGNKA